MEPIKKLEALIEEKINTLKYNDIEIKISQTHTPELVISLCGFIGTNIHSVAEAFKEILSNEFGYDVVEIIEMSDLIKQNCSRLEKYKDYDFNSDRSKLSRYDYLNKLIDCGNELRETFGYSILSGLAINKILFERDKAKEANESKKYEPRRVCYIIDSLKNTKELELLKIIYNNIHYSVGVFSTVEIREHNIVTNNKEEDNTKLSRAEFEELVDRDSGEDKKHGQQVRDTFTESDFFLRLDEYNLDKLNNRITRFLHLIFGSKVITPTYEETAMYQATSAASNSACLSRQVGAALTDENGEILSIGWNDVPKFGGDLYKEVDIDNKMPTISDNRCYKLSENFCWNDAEKEIMSRELTKILIENELVKSDKKEEIINILKKSKIKSLVEFSRSIHAEMHAIILASQKAGNRVKNGSLFITTYPCHMCARHIIVAGIQYVYYIEPYRKSLTTKLHFDAISENEKDQNKVKILMFEGVSPYRYMELFKMQKDSRKTNEEGKLKKYVPKKTNPKTKVSLESIPVLEGLVSESLRQEGFNSK